IPHPHPRVAKHPPKHDPPERPKPQRLTHLAPRSKPQRIPMRPADHIPAGDPTVSSDEIRRAVATSGTGCISTLSSKATGSCTPAGDPAVSSDSIRSAVVEAAGGASRPPLVPSGDVASGAGLWGRRAGLASAGPRERLSDLASAGARGGREDFASAGARGGRA